MNEMHSPPAQSAPTLSVQSHAARPCTPARARWSTPRASPPRSACAAAPACHHTSQDALKNSTHAKNKLVGRNMPFSAGNAQIPVVAGKPGDMAWRRRISWCFYPRHFVLKNGIHFRAILSLAWKYNATQLCGSSGSSPPPVLRFWGKKQLPQ